MTLANDNAITAPITAAISATIHSFSISGEYSFTRSQRFLLKPESLLMSNLKKLLRSKKAVISTTALLTGLGFLLTGLFTEMVPVIIGVILAATFGLSRRTLLLNYINKHIPSEQRATIISAIAMFRQFILMILNSIIGIFIDMSLSTVLVILGIIAVIWSLISPVKEKYLIN